MVCKNKWCKSQNLETVSGILQNIWQPTRLRIICILKSKDGMCACDIAKELNLKQNLVSHHLKKLKKLSFIDLEKHWKERIYSIKLDDYTNFISTLDKVLNI